MGHTEQRNKLRAILAGSKCLTPASVHDPLSARVAESMGYEVAHMGGSVASFSTLAAPDFCVLTLTERADATRRIMRAVTKLCVTVDADHGYGNALNVMRTTQELEHAGVSGFTIEDTALPRRYGQAAGVGLGPEKDNEIISTEEMVGKLRAALAARQDPSLVVLARTCLYYDSLEGIVARVKAYAATGIDGIFLLGLEKLEQLDAVYAAAKLPIILAGGVPASITRDQVAARGVRIQIQGQQAIAATVKALQDTYAHFLKGGTPAEIKSKIATPQEMAALVSNDDYQKWQREFLG